MPNNTPPKPFQIVVWGASGFTGKLVCEHLANQPDGVRWAMAGRNKAKLERVRDELAQVNKRCQDVPIIVADSFDIQTLKDMAAQAQVVLTTVGPYSKHSGEKLVEACVDAQTHYCDLTAEPTYIKRLQEKYDAAAKQKGAKIVPCCGFDSIPSDLCTLFAVDYCRTKFGKNCAEVHTAVKFEGRGGASGGTVETGFWLAGHESRAEQEAMSRDQYYLVRDRTKVGRDKPPSKWPTWDGLLGSWTAPWIMEGMNAKVVHLSNALSAKPYGRDFRYSERMEMPGLVAAIIMSFITRLGSMLFRNPITRPLLRRILPQSGNGPSKEMMLSGSWTMHFAAVTEEPPGQKPTIIKGTIQDLHGDCGYWSTSRMMVEAGLALALQQEELQAAGLAQGGVLTPATAMGLVLLKRLQAAGITCRVDQDGRTHGTTSNHLQPPPSK